MDKQALVQLGIDAYRGTGDVANYSKEKVDDAIRNAFTKILGTTTPDYRLMKKYENEIFEVIEEVLDIVMVDGWTQNPFFEQFVEYKDLNWGDKNEFYVEDRSMLIVSEIARGHWNLRRQKLNVGDTFPVKVKTYGVKVYTDFMRLLAGRIDWASFVDKIRVAVDHKIATEIYDSFIGSRSDLPTEFKESGSFDEDNLLDIVEHVYTANGYSPVMIAGTRKALKNIVDDVDSDWISDNMKSQRNQEGVIRTWEGIPLMPIPQVHKPNTFDFKVDNDKLMVLPNNTQPIKFVREGRSLIKETDGFENMDQSVEHTFITNFGVAVVFNVLYGMYDVSS